MHHDPNEHEQDAELQRLPFGRAGAPAAPGDPYRLQENPAKGCQTEQAGLGPEVQDDVMGIDQLLGVHAAAVAIDGPAEAGQSGAEDGVISQHPEGGTPEAKALLERVVWIGEVDLMTDPAGDRWDPRDQQGANRDAR